MPQTSPRPLSVARIRDRLPSPVRIERHRQGPRLFVLGRRLHECHLGLALLAVAAAVAVFGGPLAATAPAAVVASWLVLKDWRDLRAGTRDTAAWSWGLHRLADSPPASPARDHVPRLAGLATATVGAVNVASAMMGELPARVDALLNLAPAAEIRLAHALALPVGLALVGLAWPIARRRRRAAHLAIGALAALGALNLLRGLDVEEAALSWALAALLWHTRAAFWVRHPRRRLAAVDAEPDRARAIALVRAHGDDTLSAFKLRRDVRRRYSDDGRTMTAYRIEAGTMLLSGDPVGPRGTLASALQDALTVARSHGLALGAVGVSEELAAVARRVGLRSLYLGDEAIVPTGAMDLSGGTHKSLRKAVGRVERHGYTATVTTVADLAPATVAELDAVSDRWRDGAAERGFSMAHDTLVDDALPDAVIIAARDDAGAIRGFLHFVPVYGRPALSLAFMRRDRSTPNGLMDFLVVRAAELLAARGVQEFSLNFATCGRWLREPGTPLEALTARILRVADRWFQVERLLRFNEKFSPRWQPRYLLFDRVGHAPRVALAALWTEGHLPRPGRLVWRSHPVPDGLPSASVPQCA